MRKGPGIEIFPDLAQVRAVAIELEDLRGGIAVGWPSARAAARINEDMALGVEGDAGNLAKVQIRRQLQQVCDRIVWNLRRR